ncbi:MAG: hypothetical protein M9928_17780 [Anaerolineae bacterium]|nr:hypothetical protein [Anaerolineae bacterium]
MSSSFPGVSPLFSVALGMALGALLGSFNGFLITTGGVPPIIATLGTLSIYRGLIFVYSQGQWVNSMKCREFFAALAKRTARHTNIILIARWSP